MLASEAEILEMEKELLSHKGASVIDAVDALLADDFSETGRSGKTYNKQEAIASLIEKEV